MRRAPTCLAPTIADALHLAAATMIVRAHPVERDSLVAALRRLARGASVQGRGIDVRHLVLGHAGVSRLDLEGRHGAAKLASSDHWSHWLHWLRWFETGRYAAYATVELADEVLRECLVCGELRLELIA